MELFKLKPVISSFNNFEEFAKEFNITKKDLVITNEFLFEPYMSKYNLECNFIMQENYGLGEPSDEMIDNILKDIKKINYNRIIAIGGGTVIDIAKIISIKGITKVENIFESNFEIKDTTPLVIIPTTCGTGSEVTNVAITELKQKHTKLGISNDSILPTDAVFIPELLKGLPYKFYLCSAIDALIHATESYVSPKANIYTRIFSVKAIEIIIDVFKNLVQKGADFRFTCFKEMLIASNFAGIAFGNAGVGAVHALSYPMGANFHIPHGESNYLFFTKVFEIYNQKDPNGSIKDINNLYSNLLGTTKPFKELDNLLSKLIEKKRLSEYGMKESQIKEFSVSVIEKQQRLLKNNYVYLSQEEIENIYQQLY